MYVYIYRERANIHACMHVNLWAEGESLLGFQKALLSYAPPVVYAALSF